MSAATQPLGLDPDTLLYLWLVLIDAGRLWYVLRYVDDCQTHSIGHINHPKTSHVDLADKQLSNLGGVIWWVCGFTL